MFVFQAEDGIRYLVRSRGLGDVYKRQLQDAIGQERRPLSWMAGDQRIVKPDLPARRDLLKTQRNQAGDCLLYTSDAADERSSVDLGGRRIIKKKKRVEIGECRVNKSNTNK